MTSTKTTASEVQAPTDERPFAPRFCMTCGEFVTDETSACGEGSHELEPMMTVVARQQDEWMKIREEMEGSTAAEVSEEHRRRMTERGEREIVPADLEDDDA